MSLQEGIESDAIEPTAQMRSDAPEFEAIHDEVRNCQAFGL